MIRYFENLIDPFEETPLEAHPPKTVFSFLKAQCQPYKKLLAFLFVFALCVSLIEVLFLVAIGRFIDNLQSSPFSGNSLSPDWRVGPCFDRVAPRHKRN